MAGRRGLEPPTARLTAESSAIELPTIIYNYEGVLSQLYYPQPSS